MNTSNFEDEGGNSMHFPFEGEATKNYVLLIFSFLSFLPFVGSKKRKCTRVSVDVKR